MLFNEKPNGYSSTEDLVSLGTQDTVPAMAFEPTEPKARKYTPRRESVQKAETTKKAEEELDEAEKERLYLELEEYINSLNIPITTETKIKDIEKLLKEIQSEQKELDQKCEQMVKENKKQGETELSASNERGSQVLEGKVDEDILNLKIASIRCGTKIYSLKRILTLKKKLGDFKPQLSSELKHAA
jgi:hypothetical protein